MESARKIKHKRNSAQEAEKLFGNLDETLAREVDKQYFKNPNDFKSLLSVLHIVSDGSNELMQSASSHENIRQKLQQSDMYISLLRQQELVTSAIEEVVKKQDGSMNNAVDTMGNVIQTYTGSRDEVRALRNSLLEINEILSPNVSSNSSKGGTTKRIASLKELWSKKVQHESYLVFLDELEKVKNAPETILRLVDQKRYLCAVKTLNTVLASMFSPGLVHVGALSEAREELLDQKAKLLEYIVTGLTAECFGASSGGPEGGARASKLSDRAEALRDGDNQQYPWRSVQSSSPPPPSSSSSKNNASSSSSWIIGMEDVTVEAEAAHFDPSKTGPFFIRLLVQASRELGCGEDVARMLLENSKGGFRGVVARLKNELLASVAASDSNNNSNSSEHIFREYVKLLLSNGYSALRNLFYILRLLYLSGAVTTDTSEHQDVSIPAGEESIGALPRSIEKAIMDVWSDIGGIILKDLRRHLMGTSRSRGSMLGGDGDDDDGFLARASSSSVISSSKESIENVVCDPHPLFAIHAYTDVQEFSAAVQKLFVEQTGSTGKASSLESDAGPSLDFNFKFVTDALSKIVTDEVIPGVQSGTNKLISELMVNPKYFRVSAEKSGDMQDEDDFKAFGANWNVNNVDIGVNYGSGGMLVEGQGSRTCVAATRVAHTALSLLLYWRRLPHHKDHTSTILGRLVSGYVMAAREELDNLTWKTKSSEEDTKVALQQQMLRDGYFKSYCDKVWAVLGSVPEVEVGDNGDNSNVLGYWEDCGALVGSGVTGTKAKEGGLSWVAADASVLAGVVAITESCSWLAGRLLAYAQSIGLDVLTGSKNVQSIDPSQADMRDAMREYARQLFGLARTGLIVLRGEMQLACIQVLSLGRNIRIMAAVEGDVSGASSKAAKGAKGGGKGTKSTASGGGSGNGVGASNKDGGMGAVKELSRRLQSYHKVISEAASPETIAVILAPTCSLLPSLVNLHVEKEVKSLKRLPSSIEATSALKTQVLRCIEGFEQSVSCMLDDSSAEIRQLYLHMAKEFSRTRKAAVAALQQHVQQQQQMQQQMQEQLR